MSHSSSIGSNQQRQVSPIGIGAVATLLFAAAIIAVTLSLLMATVPTGGFSVGSSDDAAAVAPVLPAVFVAPHDTGVPDASTVFAGKEFLTEEPVPTF